MFAASFRSNTNSEYVFLCVRSSVRVCVTTVWAPTIGYLCLFLEGGAQETWSPRVIGWLATVRSLLWRVLYAGFFRFQLNVECSTLEGHLKCVVFACVCVSVCVFVCLRTLLFHFHTQRSFSKDETTSRAGKMGPETRSVIFPRCPACQFDSICVCRRDLTRKRRSYEHNSKLFLVMSKSHLIRRGITLSVNVCVCSLCVIKDFWLLVYCLSEVSFVWMWLVPAFFLFLACTGEDAAWFQRARLDRRLLSWAVSERKRCHRLLKRWVFQENLCTVQTQKKKKTQKHKY